jgi:hypothetical protein
MPKVYLISEPSTSRVRDHKAKNMEPLYEHGEIVVLVRSGEHPGFQPARVMRLIRQRLTDFNFETDFVAHVGGDPLAVLMVGMALADMSVAEDGESLFHRVRWLRYDRPEAPGGGRTHEGARYVPTDVEIDPESLGAESAHPV